MNFDLDKTRWVGKPARFMLAKDSVTITTTPHTDLWQRTYYGFRSYNAPLLLLDMAEKYFSFSVNTEFESKRRYDQCGIVVHIDADNWLKASVEYENSHFQRLGSVVTNNGHSDWASSDIDAKISFMRYRLSRRENDFRIEHSVNNGPFQQMRICHLSGANGQVGVGIYACSPEDSTFTARFNDFIITDCQWPPHG